ncbi:MAG: membrane protease YdiL (CAAX protease family) [Natronomonas sp.]|jgi:membrane protease YdiL (CAAX protease family)|uniref:CPBP family intramembrane glutamic endopeptidase n=1 Tax=Natronomonas sp. TaxID=2184060 RepID=UPI003989BEEF
MRSRLRSVIVTTAGRLRTPWRLFLTAGLVLLVNLAVGVGAVFAGVSLDPTTATGLDLAVALVALGVSGIAVAATTLFATRYIDHRRIGDIGVRFDEGWRFDFVVGAAIGAGLVGAVYLLGIAVGVYQPSIDPTAPSGVPLVGWLVLLVALMVVIGVYEELLVRGYILTNLAEGFTFAVGRRGAVVVAILSSSAVFGVVHGVNPNTTPFAVATITLAGILFGLAYAYTETLALPAGIHVTWNLTHVLLGLPVSGLDLGIQLVDTSVSGPVLVHGGSFGPEGGVLGTAAALLGCVVVVAYGRLTGRSFSENVAIPALRKER